MVIYSNIVQYLIGTIKDNNKNKNENNKYYTIIPILYIILTVYASLSSMRFWILAAIAPL